MAITSATEVPALQQQRRAPTYFPGNDEDPSDAEPAPSADFSFSDLLDVINPLQHIPVVSSIYRAITGDTISPTANVMGSALFGGPVGALAAAATEMFSEMTGGSPDEHLLAMLNDDPTDAGAAPAAAGTQAEAPALAVAEAAPPPVKSPAETPPAPSALFQALQGPAGTAGSEAQLHATERKGRDIRSYLAEAAPPRQALASLQSPDRQPPATAKRTADIASAEAPETEEREAMRAAVAAAHARGIEMLRQQSEAHSAAPVPDVPDWFAERLMQGLEKYRDGSQLGSDSTPAFATSG